MRNVGWRRPVWQERMHAAFTCQTPTVPVPPPWCRLVDAIAVAQAVLKADPAYPAIRRDILDKARAGLRP